MRKRIEKPVREAGKKRASGEQSRAFTKVSERGKRFESKTVAVVVRLPAMMGRCDWGTRGRAPTRRGLTFKDLFPRGRREWCWREEIRQEKRGPGPRIAKTSLPS